MKDYLTSLMKENSLVLEKKILMFGKTTQEIEMNKTAIISMMMFLIVSAMAMAASSENDEQILAFDDQQPPSQQEISNNKTLALAIVFIIFLWYIRKNQ